MKLVELYKAEALFIDSYNTGVKCGFKSMLDVYDKKEDPLIIIPVGYYWRFGVPDIIFFFKYSIRDRITFK